MPCSRYSDSNCCYPDTNPGCNSFNHSSANPNSNSRLDHLDSPHAAVGCSLSSFSCCNFGRHPILNSHFHTRCCIAHSTFTALPIWKETPSPSSCVHTLAHIDLRRLDSPPAVTTFATTTIALSICPEENLPASNPRTDKLLHFAPHNFLGIYSLHSHS